MGSSAQLAELAASKSTPAIDALVRTTLGLRMSNGANGGPKGGARDLELTRLWGEALESMKRVGFPKGTTLRDVVEARVGVLAPELEPKVREAVDLFVQLCNPKLPHAERGKIYDKIRQVVGLEENEAGTFLQKYRQDGDKNALRTCLLRHLMQPA